MSSEDKSPRLTPRERADRYNTAYGVMKNTAEILAKSESWSKAERQSFYDQSRRNAEHALKGELLEVIKLPESAK